MHLFASVDTLCQILSWKISTTLLKSLYFVFKNHFHIDLNIKMLREQFIIELSESHD